MFIIFQPKHFLLTRLENGGLLSIYEDGLLGDVNIRFGNKTRNPHKTRTIYQHSHPCLHFKLLIKNKIIIQCRISREKYLNHT